MKPEFGLGNGPRCERFGLRDMETIKSRRIVVWNGKNKAQKACIGRSCDWAAEPRLEAWAYDAYREVNVENVKLQSDSALHATKL